MPTQFAYGELNITVAQQQFAQQQYHCPKGNITSAQPKYHKKRVDKSTLMCYNSNGENR
jgi:hypothetical protein